MCGRYAITSAPEAIRRLFQIPGPTPNFAPHYNAAPGQELPVIRLHPESGERVIGTLRWGLIPYWSARRLIALIGLVLVRLPLLAAAPKVFRRNPPGRSAAGK